MSIKRHRTAIGRSDLSKPIRMALADSLIPAGASFFDYGCGRGQDCARLAEQGFSVSGWDPYFRPTAVRVPSSVVNIGYVVNVIEDPAERERALLNAWSLTEDLLIVSARLSSDVREGGFLTSLSDGHLTSRGTFQKLFEQAELRDWIEKVTESKAVPAAPGVFYVFRSEKARLAFQAERYRRSPGIASLKFAELWSTKQAELQPLINFLSRRGRLPTEYELGEDLDGIHATFGNIRRAFEVIRRHSVTENWNAIAAQRAQDLSIYLALSQFDGRPKFSDLPEDLKNDVRAFFSTYTKACKVADSLLLKLGDQAHINEACRASDIGKLTPEALYIHVSALDALPTSLRLLEGCARGYLGRVEGANIIKLHRKKPKVSYLSYPHFELDPHPQLSHSLVVDLKSFRVRTMRFALRRNPPILHRKEEFINESHPLFAKFEKLTLSEEKFGLYDNPSVIGTLNGWQEVLNSTGVYLQGHRILKKNSDPCA